MSKLQEYLSEMEKRHEQVKSIFDKADAEQDGEATKEQIEEVKRLNKEIADIDAKAADLKEAAALREQNEKRREEAKRAGRLPLPGSEEKGDGQDRGSERFREAKRIQTTGEMFVKHIEDYLKTVAPDGNVLKGARIHTPALQVKTLITGLSSTSAGAFVTNDQRGMLDMGAYQRPLTVRDLITNGQTGSDTVEYVREGTHTNNAAPVAEATGTANGTGIKPESAMLFSVVTETVKTIAHWVPATRRALADAAQLRTYIDQFLRYGIDEELEDQILTGDGTGENFTGILNTSGTTAQAYDTSVLITTRRARTKVRTVGRANPTGYVMHPNDWEDLDLTMDGENRFYFGGPLVMGTPRLWGLPIVESEAMTEGTAVVADWRRAVLWDREQTNILVSDSHSDFFIRNLIAILAEMRAAFGVIRPAAFVEIDLTA